MKRQGDAGIGAADIPYRNRRSCPGIVNTMKLPAALIVCLVLSGCVTPGPGQVHRITLSCDDRSIITLDFEPGAVGLENAAGRFRLDRKRGGPGMFYEGDGYSIRGRRMNLTYIAPGSPPTQCQPKARLHRD